MVTETMDPRYVHSDHGWWFPEKPAEMDEGLFGLWDTDVNSLIRWQAGQAGVGTNYKTMLCKVYPVRSDDMHNEWTSNEAYAYESEEAAK